MADYKLMGSDESTGVFYKPENLYVPNDGGNRHWNIYLAWKATDPVNNVADPQYTTEEQEQIDYEARQDARVANLKGALINQFKMILALFQVGRDKGLWVVADFDPDLVTIAQSWIATINDYENDAPGS